MDDTSNERTSKTLRKVKELKNIYNSDDFLVSHPDGANNIE